MRRLLDEFFQHYLAERDLEATLALLTEDVFTIGTGEHEIARNKNEFRELLASEISQLPHPLKYEIFEYAENVFREDVAHFLTTLSMTLYSEDGGLEMQCRLSGTSIKKDGQWKFNNLHMSTSEMEQEQGSFFPLYFGKRTAGKMLPESGEKLMDLISVSLPGGIVGGYLEDGFPLYTINEKMLNIIGYSYEELAELFDEKMLNIVYSEDRERVEETILTQLAEKDEYEVEYRVVGKDGRLIWMNDVGKKILTYDGRDAMISIMTDISERIERERKLKKEAERDPLTKLYNRKSAMRKIKEEFQKKDGGCLFICDVDNFKSINDTKGHAAGDAVLRQLAVIMQEQAREISIIARLGGDEYILFFPESVQRQDAIDTVCAIQKRFLAYMREFSPELKVSLSAGGTQRTRKEDIHQLYDQADAALYQAKQKKGELQMNMRLQYQVKRIKQKSQIEQCEKFFVQHYMWNSRQEPKTYGWLGYLENEGLFVKMVCEEKEPKRCYEKPNDPVYQDSAMEIFLCFPEEGQTLSNDCMYTNFEINANGAMLANYGKGRNGRKSVSKEVFEGSKVRAVVEDDRWYLEVLFPESYLKEICDLEKIKEGKNFYCNFYKIAESEEIQHFGSYSPIESETPNFHLPVCFAEAVIEKN